MEDAIIVKKTKSQRKKAVEKKLAQMAEGQTEDNNDDDDVGEMGEDEDQAEEGFD